MTLLPDEPYADASTLNVAASRDPDPEITAMDAENSPSAASSFSDAYNENSEGLMNATNEISNASGGVIDDYAMTFDSDGEEQSVNQDITQEEADKETTITISNPSYEMPSSISALGIQSNTMNLPRSDSQPSHNTPSPSQQVIDTSAIDSHDAHTAQKKSQPNTYEEMASGDIDIQQLLDNITANAENNPPAPVPSATPSNISMPKGLPAHSSLPPRPQILQQPATRPSYASHDEVSKYQAGAPGFPPQASAYRPPGVLPSLVGAGAPGTSTNSRSGLPPPPTGSFQTSSISAASPISPSQFSQAQKQPGQDQLLTSVESPDVADDADQPWGPAVQKIYDEFLSDERMYVTEGLWDRFPVGSRLFIGNLPTEKVTKRDLFHVFHKYGKLAQISIKQAYGFVQFHDSSACYNALDREQGQEVRGRKMHLEISKPQKNTRNAQGSASTKKSRSPDRARGHQSDRNARGSRSGQGEARGGGADRYDPRSSAPSRDEYGRSMRTRDDYRPARSPSPRGSYRSRDDYGAPRDRDYYENRDRHRSRSRSPYGHRDNGRYRERSFSPRARDANADSELQIPRREPRDVPDVQIILMDELDRGFVSWVVDEFRGRGIKSDVMFLSPRLPLQSVIRRQILEGVSAVSQLNMKCQHSSKISLQVFDRQGGADNVRFDEYQDLEPKIAAELVLRAKQTQAQASAYSQYTSTAPYQPPSTVPQTPNIASLVGQLDNATLQKLLGTLNIPSQQPQQQHPQNPTPTQPSIDLAGLLGGLQQQQQQPLQHHQSYQGAPVTDPYASLASNPTLASLLGNSATSQPGQGQAQQSAQQVQNIMAQLAKFRQ